MPGPAITSMMAVGIGLIVLGGVAIFIGIAIPMSGAVILGGGLVLGGAVTVAFGRAMSQRTSSGAYVDAMLKAYRRTLQKTMEMARNIEEVARQPEVAKLADTPDKAVVGAWRSGCTARSHPSWNVAWRQRQATGSPRRRVLPRSGSPPTTDSGPSGGSAAAVAGGVAYGSGSIFSDPRCPTSAACSVRFGSVGSTPASSSSGGGFGGGWRERRWRWLRLLLGAA